MARDRGDRLYPSKSSGRFHVLTQLRKANEYIIEKYINHRGVLIDFGCGNLPYKPLYAPFVDEYIGADIELNRFASVLIDEKLSIKAASETFDYVLSTQVLEHVEDYQAYLTEVARILKPQGLLILSTHGHWQYHPDPCDFWRWTLDGLEKIIVARGFELEESLGVMGLRAAGLQLFQDGLVPAIHLRLRKPLFLCIQWLQRMSDSENWSQRDASVLIVIARKL